MVRFKLRINSLPASEKKTSNGPGVYTVPAQIYQSHNPFHNELFTEPKSIKQHTEGPSVYSLVYDYSIMATTVDAIPDNTPATNMTQCRACVRGLSSSPNRVMWNSIG